MAEQNTPPSAIRCRDLSYRYGDRLALDGLSLDVQAGEVFTLLGPNGSGKSTLFRLISTLVPVQQGTIEIAGVSVSRDPLAVRGRIGIVFQSPSLDKKLTVDENIACQAALYGISGRQLETRRNEVLALMKLTDRRGDFCETLSGGLKRRVELAKGILHQPAVMLLDEPSTGLDPAARLDLWRSLRAMADAGMTVLLTTHLLEEADKSDRVAILSEGRLIAIGKPDQLRAELGEGVITVQASDLERVERILRDDLQLQPQRIAQRICVRCQDAPQWVPRIAQRLGDSVQSISVGRPGLEDVFMAKTGQHFDR